MHFDDILNKNFQLFEAYCIRNVFSIPEGYIPSYRLQCKTVESEEDIAKLDSDLSMVINQLKKVTFIASPSSS